MLASSIPNVSQDQLWTNPPCSSSAGPYDCYSQTSPGSETPAKHRGDLDPTRHGRGSRTRAIRSKKRQVLGSRSSGGAAGPRGAELDRAGAFFPITAFPLRNHSSSPQTFYDCQAGLTSLAQ